MILPDANADADAMKFSDRTQNGSDEILIVYWSSDIQQCTMYIIIVFRVRKCSTEKHLAERRNFLENFHSKVGFLLINHSAIFFNGGGGGD